MFATMTRVQSVARVASRCWSVVKVATSDVPRKSKNTLAERAIHQLASLLCQCGSLRVTVGVKRSKRFYGAITGSPIFSMSGLEVTPKFRYSQFVTPVL